MHPLSWSAWFVLVMSVALLSSNPLYLAVLLLAVALVVVLAPRTETAVAGLRAMLLAGGGLLLFSVLVAGVNGTYGDTVLFTIPGPEFPSWLGGLRLGGPVSAEGFAAAGIRGLAILCVFVAFAAFNGAVSPYRLLRTAPAALFSATLVVTVGLTLLPSTLEDLRRIREMRALRGAGGGLRDLPALVVPAVLGGLERSMRLAEAMEARGYASSDPAPVTARLAGLCSAPLLLAASWLWFYESDLRPLGAALALLAGICIVLWATIAARARRTTRFAEEPLPAGERVLAAASFALAVAAIGASIAGVVDLDYNPFAGLGWPRFAIPGALLALAAAWPAVVFALLRPVADVQAAPMPTLSRGMTAGVEAEGVE